MRRIGAATTGAGAVAVVAESGSGDAPRAAGACGELGMAKYRASSLHSVELQSPLPLVESIQYPVHRMLRMPGDLR